ncbi:MAG TPA: diacylglycerol kinase family protein [Kofleriaceae bacterium]|nr:diacylglycerol kinase family protein [Kofleriaceae bacterium]
MRVAVIVNAGAGSISYEKCEDRVREIQARFEEIGIETEIFLCEPERLTATARRAATHAVDAVVAAGGDGTVSAIAAGLVGGARPLAVLPLGTLNHFARDLGMPTDLGDAVRAIATAERTTLDVAEVNGRVFINNSSIGLYPEAVRLRDEQRETHGRGKWLAMMIAAFRVLKRFRKLSVLVDTPHGRVAAITPFVFVGNNEYGTSLGSLGKRSTLDRGRLSLFTVRCRGRLHMLYVLARALFGRTEEVRELEAGLVTEINVATRHRQLDVALDGETTRMGTPLRYRIRPGALVALVPSAAQPTVAPPEAVDAAPERTAVSA